MTSRNSHLRVGQSFPSYWNAEYGRAITFMEKYYQYLDSTFTGDLDNINDIDAVDSSFLVAYQLQYGIDSPAPVTDLKEFLKNSRQFFLRKGTPEAIKYFFRAVFGDEAVITYPSENILRASDGGWDQESFITVLPISGVIPEAPFDLTIENDYGTYIVPVTRVDYTEEDTPRFYFKNTKKVKLIENQSLLIYTDQTTPSFYGKLLKSPANLKIISPGKNWKLGQVFVIPGSIDNTICQVTAIDANKGVKSIAIVEHGHGHTQGQLTVVSPYKYKPADTTTNITQTITSIDPLTYDYTLSVEDYTYGAYDSIIAFSDSESLGARVFLDQYVTTGYVGSTVIEQYSYPTSISVPSSQSIDITDWIESQTYVALTYDYQANERGQYNTYTGQLSHPGIKTQDNYFYQAFSYLIDSSTPLNEYKTVLSLLNPAGLKYFTNLEKINEFTIPVSIDVRLSAETIFLFNVIDLNSSKVALFTKSILDDYVTGTTYLSKDLIKSVSSSLETISAISTKDVVKSLNSNFNQLSQLTYDITTIKASYVNMSDENPYMVFDKSLQSSFGTSVAATTDVVKSLISSELAEITDSILFIRNYFFDSILSTPISTFSYSSVKLLVGNIYTESALGVITEKLIDSPVITSSQISSKSTEKLFDSNINIVSLDNASVDEISYTETSFFSEEYTDSDLILTIG